MNKVIIIVTALELEFLAVKKFLSEVKPVRHPETGTIYETGVYDTGRVQHRIAIVQSGPGNSRSADETSRAISFFKPTYTFFVGIAGGLKDVVIGDVVAATKVIGYEMSKAKEKLLPRFDTVPVSYKLEQIAKFVSRQGEWSNGLKSEHPPKSIVGPIAAGEKLVASNKSSTYKFLRQHCSDALAVEMEGIGFFQPVRAYFVDGIVVRGVSDLIENKESTDALGSQDVAALNAAKFTFEMVSLLDDFKQDKPALDDDDFKKQLVEELAQLYDQGPETDQIWKRAGGNVGILSNSSTRKAQWYDAVDRLYKGGGGRTITLKSLIEQVKIDYPQNKFFSQIDSN